MTDFEKRFSGFAKRNELEHAETAYLQGDKTRYPFISINTDSYSKHTELKRKLTKQLKNIYIRDGFQFDKKAGYMCIYDRDMFDAWAAYRCKKQCINDGWNNTYLYGLKFGLTETDAAAYASKLYPEADAAKN